MNKTNIGFFSGDITRSGGTERVAILIAEKLNLDNKYNISFISLTERKEKPFYNISDSIKRYTLSDKEIKGAKNIVAYTRQLKKIVKKNKIDVLIDIDGIIDLYAVPVKWMTGVKIISWEHFNIYNHPKIKLRNRVRKIAVKNVNAIVTLTEQDKEYYQKELRFKCPICAIHNPKTYIDTENEEYKKESKTIISVGRLTYQKGFDRLVQVADNVLKKYPEWQWKVFGEGEDQQMLQDMIKERSLEKNVKLMGNVDDISQEYHNSAMFVMTSRFEGLPMTLLEAKCHKLPCISFDIKTGPRECIVDGVNGYLLSDGNIEEMSTKIEELISDNEKRIDFSKHAQDNMDDFDIETIVPKWKELINTIAD